jgi:hypothetical protein
MGSPEATQESLRNPPNFTKYPPDSTSCSSHWPPANTDNPGQVTVTHTHISSHTCLLTHSLSLILHKSPFKIATKKTKLSPNSIVWSLYPGMITEKDQLRIHCWAPLPEMQNQSCTGFHEQREDRFLCRKVSAQLSHCIDSCQVVSGDQAVWQSEA